MRSFWHDFICPFGAFQAFLAPAQPGGRPKIQILIPLNDEARALMQRDYNGTALRLERELEGPDPRGPSILRPAYGAWLKTQDLPGK